MDKTHQTAKLEQMVKAYKGYKKMLKEVTKDNGVAEAELFWVKTMIKDLKWVLDDTQY